MAYKWRTTHHINILEFTSVLNYFRKKFRSAFSHGFRYLHIVDSRVTAGVLAKGRSSSKRLNRPCRRLAAYLLAADGYVLPLWTISRWMAADRGSRLYAKDDGEE